MTFPMVVERLVEFVIYNDRFNQLGLRGGAMKIFLEVCDREPTKEEVDEVIRDFWQFWHDKFDDPRPLPPVGRSMTHYPQEELSPWQENAIRALEDSIDAED